MNNLFNNDKILKNLIGEVNAMSILLKNGTIIDYKNSIFEKFDILIEDNTIKTIAKNI